MKNLMTFFGAFIFAILILSGCGSKMTVCELKTFIKLNRPKGHAREFQVTKKKKREALR